MDGSVLAIPRAFQHHLQTRNKNGGGRRNPPGLSTRGSLPLGVTTWARRLQLPEVSAVVVLAENKLTPASARRSAGVWEKKRKMTLRLSGARFSSGVAYKPRAPCVCTRRVARRGVCVRREREKRQERQGRRPGRRRVRRARSFVSSPTVVSASSVAAFEQTFSPARAARTGSVLF
ncbi:hypothetical protein MTO96_037249 [Rhipicephalus appendiculatus]